MEREKLYLDTSVASAYFDERNPRRMEITHAFWLQTVQEYDLSVSEVTIREIVDAQAPWPGLARGIWPIVGHDKAGTKAGWGMLKL
jgi:hypothetical protein